MPTSAKIRQKKQSLDERIAALQQQKAQEQSKLLQAVRKEEAREERQAGKLLRELGFALHDLEALRVQLKEAKAQQDEIARQARAVEAVLRETTKEQVL